MHLLGWLPDGVDDRDAARAALRQEVDVPPLSGFRLGPAGAGDRGGLVLGYAAYTPREIDDACVRLGAALGASDASGKGNRRRKKGSGAG
jgi:GntR family transcriptional regulator/MocR family aminotransferase